MRRISVTAFVTAILLGLLSPVASPVDAQVAVPVSQVRAGVAVTDITWNVGSGAGQYAGDREEVDLQEGEIDPHMHSVKSEPSKGVHSRLTTRTLVVEGNNGEKVALVKTDNYLAQDLYTRRAAQHLAAAGSSITYDDIVLSATHNHSSPYNMSPSAGLLLFQDAFDLRMFEFQARKIAESILAAEADLRPARMGATTVHHDIFKGNIVGPSRADDGTPAGYPRDFGDEGLVVLRFDDMTSPATPKPLATWMNYGQHPESLDETNIITADFLSALERYVDRETGAPLVFTQGDVGSAEGPYEHWNGGQMDRLPSGEYRAWAHMGHAQMERGARHLADSVMEGWSQIGAGGGTVPLTSDFPVMVYSRWTPGPVSHPYPSLSNCRMEGTVEGNPGMPTGEDCSRELDNNDPSRQEFEQLKALGVPVPDHFDHPGHLLLEENNRLRLQAVRLGDVILASCSCEAQVDLILNLESRLNDVQGDIWDGYDWGAAYTQNADGTWSAPGLPTITDDRYRHMQAQVHNDAKGWDDPANAAAANSEPLDPTKIWGNFTKEELAPDLGYKVAVGMGHSGDYLGYTVSYREYMTRNHYRKSLTSYGPHTADYMNTRLVRMAASLKGGPAVADEPTHALGLADEVRSVAFSQALGRAAGAAYDAYLLGMSDDLDPGVIVAQPAPTMQRFGAATFAWQGGNNAVDNPVVRVERLADGAWKPYADMTGEVQTFLEWPRGLEGVANSKTGSHAWKWTANFEAFDAWPRTTVPGGQVPNGTYRFVVYGKAHAGGAVQPYSLTSDSFDVTPWTGISVSDLRREANGDVSFVVDPIAYPRTYSNPAVSFFIRDDGKTTVCELCAFRPWATTGSVASASVTVGDTKVPATFDAASGRWVAPAQLWNGATAVVAPGDVVDEYGEVNGAASAPVVGNETLSAPELPVVGAAGQDGAAAKSGRDLPFRNASSLMRAAGGLAMLLVIIALFLGVGVGSKARRG